MLNTYFYLYRFVFLWWKGHTFVFPCLNINADLYFRTKKLFKERNFKAWNFNQAGTYFRISLSELKLRNAEITFLNSFLLGFEYCAYYTFTKQNEFIAINIVMGDSAEELGKFALERLIFGAYHHCCTDLTEVDGVVIGYGICTEQAVASTYAREVTVLAEGDVKAIERQSEALAVNLHKVPLCSFEWLCILLTLATRRAATCKEGDAE